MFCFIISEISSEGALNAGPMPRKLSQPKFPTHTRPEIIRNPIKINIIFLILCIFTEALSLLFYILSNSSDAFCETTP